MSEDLRRALEKHHEFWEALKECLGYGPVTADDFSRIASNAGLVYIVPGDDYWVDNDVARDALQKAKAPE